VADKKGNLLLSGAWDLLLEEVREGNVIGATSLRPKERGEGQRHELKPNGYERWKWKFSISKMVSRPGNYRFRVTHGNYTETGRLFRVVTRLDTPDWISLSYVPDKTAYFLGEPISVRFALKNNGTDEFHFEEGGDYRGATRHLRFAFAAESDKGEKAVDPMPNQGCLGGLGRSDPHVKPGEVYAKTLSLLSYLRFPSPGKYRVKCYQAMGFGVPVDDVRNAGFTGYSYGGSFEIELRQLSQQEAANVVRSFLAKRDGNERRAAFAQLSHPVYLDALSETLKTETKQDDCEALICGIASVVSAESTRRLIALASDERVAVRIAALRQLSWRLPDPRDRGEAKPDSPFRFYSKDARLQDVKTSWAETLRPDLLKMLKKGLESQNLEEVSACAYSLGALGETTTADLLANTADRVAPTVPVPKANDQCIAQIASAACVLAQLGAKPCQADKTSSPGRLAVWANMVRSRQECRTGDWQDLILHMMNLDCPVTRMAAIRWLPKDFAKRDQIPWKKLFMEQEMQIWWHAIQIAREDFPRNLKAIAQECLNESADAMKQRNFRELLEEIETRTGAKVK
jgi:hypothetical protein